MAAAVKAGEVAIYFVVQQYDDNKGDDKNITKWNKYRRTQRRGGEAVEEERDGVGVLRPGIIFLILKIKVILSDICNTSPYLASCSSTSLPFPPPPFHHHYPELTYSPILNESQESQCKE